MKTRIQSIAGALFCIAAIQTPAVAQPAYPAKTVRMILPFAPGGPVRIRNPPI